MGPQSPCLWPLIALLVSAMSQQGCVTEIALLVLEESAEQELCGYCLLALLQNWFLAVSQAFLNSENHLLSLSHCVTILVPMWVLTAEMNTYPARVWKTLWLNCITHVVLGCTQCTVEYKRAAYYGFQITLRFSFKLIWIILMYHQNNSPTFWILNYPV